MKKILLLLLLISSVVLLQGNVTTVSAPQEEPPKETLDAQELEKIELEKERQRQLELSSYLQKLQEVENKISEENVWIKSYASYLTSIEVREALKKIKKRVAYLKKKGKTPNDMDELAALISKEKILTSQIEALKKRGDAPFSELLTPSKIDEVPTISNPFDIFMGISLVKTLNADFDDYVKRKEELTNLISLLQQELEIYKNIAPLDKEKKYAQIAKDKEKQLERLETALDTITVTAEVYQKRLELITLNINKAVEEQIWGVIRISVIIIIIFVIFFLMRLAVKKYITDNERFYMANKIITFVNVTIVILILFFSYIENVSYLVTILGFASAGIAIAMKDWFMSILGWLVIVFGGSIHVGDRIRVDMDGMRYVGDVMDISLLRMTILEDITLTSITQNRRAGRIIFIPNNYVFTHMIANYTHSSLKTVWDGVKITITFDSNHKKAMHLVKEITKKFSKGYTDITRKQLNKLRHHYSLKNTNVEPRIFSFIEPNGIDIEAWYLTNAYATLTLRSVISTEIIDAFNAEDDITIAYPTQKLHVSMKSEEPAKHAHEIV